VDKVDENRLVVLVCMLENEAISESFILASSPPINLIPKDG
jgi:hypothetical protein